MQQTKSLQKKNENLQKKLKKYQQVKLWPFFLLIMIMIYTICKALHLDYPMYTPIIREIPNSIICTIMGGMISGTMLVMCKLEYRRAIKEIKKQLQHNNQRIKEYQQQNQFKSFQNQKTKQLEQHILKKSEPEMIPYIDLEQIKQDIKVKRKGR